MQRLRAGLVFNLGHKPTNRPMLVRGCDKIFFCTVGAPNQPQPTGGKLFNQTLYTSRNRP